MILRIRALSLFIVAGVAMAVSFACTPAADASTFGALCTSNETCSPIATQETGGVDTDKLHCLSSPVDGRQRCLPPRAAGAAGETCAKPIAAVQPSTTTGTLVDHRVFFGAAVDNIDLECGGRVGAPDVVLRFTIDDVTAEDPADPARRVSVPQPGIRVRVEDGGAGGYAVSLRRAVDVDACGGTERFGCGESGSDIVLASIAPGAWDLVVDGTPAGVGGFEQPVRVVVERLDCPPDALPFDERQCIRTVGVTPLSSARTQHTTHLLADGTVAVVGGRDDVGGRSDFELFDPTEQRWRFGTLQFRRVGAASIVLSEGDLLVAGGANNTSAGIELVDFDLVDTAVEHSRRLEVGGFTAVPDAVAVGGRAGDRLIVVSTDPSETGLITASDGIRTCQQSNQCLRNEICVASADTFSPRKVCLCATADCGPKPLTFRAFPGINPVDKDVRLAIVAERYAVVVGAGPGSPAGSLGLLDTRIAIPSFERIEAMERTGAAAITLNESEVLIVGGVDADGIATAAVELLDIARRQVTLKTPLPRPVARPLLSRLGDRFVVIDNEGGDEPIIFSTGSPSRVRSTLVRARTGGAIVGDENATSVLVVGGLIDGVHSRVVERLELVARDAGVAGEALDCLTKPVVEGRISGNTLTADDVVRYHQCAVPAHSFGRDNLFTFELEQNGSLRVVNMQDADEFVGSAHTVTLLKGTCDDYVEVACGTGEEEIALFAGNLTPGPYIIAVDYTRTEGQDDDAVYGGTTWSAQALLGPVLECPIDENDPADDVITGAIFIAPTAVREATTAGRLCPGDVDHIVFEHQGGLGSNSVDVSGVVASGIEVRQAIVETAASVAAGHPVATATTGPPITDLNQAPVGTYVATLTSAESSLDFISWDLSVSQHCLPDSDDSLLPELDNNSVARAPHLVAGEILERALCTTTDSDLVILDPVAGRASSLALAVAREDVRLALFDIVDGELGPARAFTAVDTGFSDTKIDLGILPGPVALRIGNATDEDLDVNLTFKQAQDGDTCQNPFNLVAEGERSGVVSGDSSSYNNDVDASFVGDCTNERAPGRDVIYAVHLEPGETLNLTGEINGEAEDISLYLLRDCVLDEDSCVVGIDSAGGLVAESIEFENGAVAHDYFVVVDSFYGSAYLWNLEWSITAP